VIPSSSTELNSGNLGSRCEAVIAVLQGLMSSEVELVPGGVTGDVTGSELAEVCQQSHVSVMGCNTWLNAHILGEKRRVHISPWYQVWHQATTVKRPLNWRTNWSRPGHPGNGNTILELTLKYSLMITTGSYYGTVAHHGDHLSPNLPAHPEEPPVHHDTVGLADSPHIGDTSHSIQIDRLASSVPPTQWPTLQLPPQHSFICQTPI